MCPLLPAVVCCCVSLLLTIAADVRVPPALDWDDNEAGYSDWGQARNLNAQGVPEDKMKKLAASYKQQGVPIGAWEVDCNFQCKPTPRSPMGTSFVLFSRFFPTHGRPWVFRRGLVAKLRRLVLEGLAALEHNRLSLWRQALIARRRLAYDVL